MANAKLALILGLAVVGTVAAFLIFNTPAQTNLRGAHLLTADDNLENVYTQWKTEFNKTYGGAENKLRFHIFATNIHRIEVHNAKNLTWTLGLNQFSDLTTEEYKSIYLGYKKAESKNEIRALETTTEANLTDLPAAIDWRAKGAVTPVKNQGQCGSCWSFSSTGALEGRNFIANGQLVSLSEQQLVDCSGAYGNQGCNGGLMDDAFKYVAAKGITTEAAYPYKAVQGRCQAFTTAVKNVAFTDVQQNPAALQAAVAQGPVAIAIEADQYTFQSYKTGVITTGCGANLDHGVLIVGYGTDNGQDYWIVKNSWGASWGEQGYIRIARGTQNSGAGECGINSSASYPTF